MKAYRMYGLNDSRLDEWAPAPKPGDGEVLIAPEAAGICGTDLHVLHEGVYIDIDRGLPVTMGHEVVGRVVSLGAEPAQGWTPPDGGEPLTEGDRVVAEPLINCGWCPQCLRGRPNLCRQWSHLGFRRDGVWAELVAIPARRLTRISDSVPREQAVLAEPLACALHFLARAQLSPGDSVAIIGGGPAGQLTLLAARAAGAGLIVVSDPVEPRRGLAMALGADAVLNPTLDDVSGQLRDLTGERGVDIVIEIAGTPPAVTQAIRLPRSGGTVVLAGICGAESIPLDTNRAVVDEIDIRGAYATRWQMDAAVRLLERADIDVSPIVSQIRPWTEADQGMRDLAERPELCKVVLAF
jgi:threonine dehydrogenase-like Zn-dependent dehydrogenase